MGGIQKMSRAELQQQERDQQAPAFLHWLADMDNELERFFTQDAPRVGALEDPWTTQGIKTAAESLKAAFPDPKNVVAMNHPALDGYRRYFGEAFRMASDGSWFNLPGKRDNVDFWPVISRPYSTFLDPHDRLLDVYAKTRHPDGLLVWVYGNVVEDHALWVEAGKPSATEFRRLSAARLSQ
uniref:hypothetical protein n=1 Tax=Nocardia donostiensis TaxID=1538463 RepID=UPI00111C7EC0|nr:hypothetical protein [Nocardia donostiensis]